MKWLKQQLRKKIITRRSALDPKIQELCAKKIAEQLFLLPCFQQANTIALYMPIGGEVATDLIVKKIQAQQKKIYLPVLARDNTLQFVQLNDQAQMIKNRFGILEPIANPNQMLAPRSLDVVLTPLVAFDRRGNRLGMGKGYYDKTFAFKRSQQSPRLIGLAYEFQKIFYVPHSNLDIKLDCVITEKKRYGDL